MKEISDMPFHGLSGEVTPDSWTVAVPITFYAGEVEMMETFLAERSRTDARFIELLERFRDIRRLRESQEGFRPAQRKRGKQEN